MPTYIALLTFTEKGAGQIRKTTARAEAFKKFAETKGIRVLRTLWLNGPFDILHIIECADSDAAMIHSLSLAALGNVKTQTFRAYTREEIEPLLEKSFNAFDLLKVIDEV